jgi:hypothetical protein
MDNTAEATEKRMFEDLQELIALEMKDIIATAAEEGFSPRDVISALELALQVEIEALASDPGANEDSDLAGDPFPAN